MIDNLSKDQIKGMFDALPFQMVFIDQDDRIQYWNESKARLMEAPRNRLGRDVRECHQEKSIPRLEQILSDFKSGKADDAAFWVVVEEIELRALNRFFAIRNRQGQYLGTMEYLLDFRYLERIAEGEKDAHTFESSPKRFV